MKIALTKDDQVKLVDADNKPIIAELRRGGWKLEAVKPKQSFIDRILRRK